MRNLHKILLALAAILIGTIAYFQIGLPYKQASEAGQFENVDGLAADKEGNIYAVDWGHSRVQKFDGDGKYLLTWGTDSTALTLDKDGNAYGIEGWTDRVTQYSESGWVLKQFGATKNGGREYINDADIALDSDGNIYVADLGDGLVRKYSREGTLVSEWGNTGPIYNNSTRHQPSSIAIDNANNMYVLNLRAGYLEKFELIQEELQNGERDSGKCPSEREVTRGICLVQDWRISGIRLAIDSKGLLYVLNNSGIGKYTADGLFVGQFGGDRIPGARYNVPYFGDITVGEDDNVYISENYCGWIIQFTSDGELVRHWGQTTDYGSFGTSGRKDQCS